MAHPVSLSSLELLANPQYLIDHDMVVFDAPRAIADEIRGAS